MYVMEFILRPTPQNPQLMTEFFFFKTSLTSHILNCAIGYAAYSDQRDNQKLMWI